ncbi:MAG TPA: PDZ domain-containing protein, partial [Kineosporiaceae bacterium]|nr:PDZ domain-containing protein [Kineosporiaceae bacterium]
SPAATSGLAEGDTITSLDGHAVRSTSDLRSVLGTLHPGQDVSLTWVDPAGQRQRSSVTLASAEG